MILRGAARLLIPKMVSSGIIANGPRFLIELMVNLPTMAKSTFRLWSGTLLLTIPVTISASKIRCALRNGGRILIRWPSSIPCLGSTPSGLATIILRGVCPANGRGRRRARRGIIKVDNVSTFCQWGWKSWKKNFNRPQLPGGRLKYQTCG